MTVLWRIYLSISPILMSLCSLWSKLGGSPWDYCCALCLYCKRCDAVVSVRMVALSYICNGPQPHWRTINTLIKNNEANVLTLNVKIFKHFCKQRHTLLCARWRLAFIWEHFFHRSRTFCSLLIITRWSWTNAPFLTFFCSLMVSDDFFLMSALAFLYSGG